MELGGIDPRSKPNIVESERAKIRQKELRRECLETFVALNRIYFALGSFAEAAEVNRRATGSDDYLEEAYPGLMRSRVALGEQALKHYRDLITLLGDELRTAPASEMRALYEGPRSREDA